MTIIKNKNWYKMDTWRQARHFTSEHVAFAITFLGNGATALERESAWDYLRAAEHFTEDLLLLAKHAQQNDESRCARDAAQDYIDAYKER